MNALVYGQAFIRDKNKVAQNEKWKKTLGFVFQKYGKFWSILLGHFIKHKPLISEEYEYLLILTEQFIKNVPVFRPYSPDGQSKKFFETKYY